MTMIFKCVIWCQGNKTQNISKSDKLHGAKLKKKISMTLQQSNIFPMMPTQ